MSEYDQQVREELAKWQAGMQKPSSFFGQIARNAQNRINKIIPEKIHGVLTSAIKQMTRAVIFGAEFTTGSPGEIVSLEETENKVRDRIKFYRNTAAAEGGITGAGGILLGLADFPIWLTLKMKMLFEIARLYGYSTSTFQERIYILHIFQITFSSQGRRNEVYRTMADWKNESRKPDDINTFDWRRFQQEYRDSIDLVKLLQLVPGIGAAVGAIVNHRLTTKLGNTAMNAYRLRRSMEDPGTVISNQ